LPANQIFLPEAPSARRRYQISRPAIR